jgi:hypothetical protein
MSHALWIDGAPLATRQPHDLYAAVTNHPAIIASARALIDRGSVKTIVPRDPANVYVFQKEIAVVERPRNEIIGSDRATTCHILIVSSPRKVCCAHLDGSPGQMLDLMLSLSIAFEEESEFDVHLAGGFDDERGLSVALGRELLAELNGWSGARFDLKTACIGPLNTASGPAPIVRALALDLRTGEVLANAWFHDRGPHAELRAATTCFSYVPLRDAAKPPGALTVPDRRYLEHLLAIQDDRMLLQLTSTSPDVEHPEYCDELRATIRYVLGMK